MRKYLLPLAICSGLMAQTATFPQVLQWTYDNNKELKAKKLDVEMARQERDQADSYNYGKLVFSEEVANTNHPLYVFGQKLSAREATFNDFGFDQFLAGFPSLLQAWDNGDMSAMQQGGDALLKTQPENLNDPDARTSFDTSVTYQLPLFTGFKLQSAGEIADLQVKAKAAGWERDRQSMGLEAFRAYNGTAAAKYFIEAVKKAKEATTEYVKISGDLHQAGMVTATDVLQARQRDAEVDATLIEAENQWQLGVAYLRFLTDNKAIEDVAGFEDLASPAADLDAAISAAMEQRPDLQAMGLNVKSAEKGVDFYGSERYPTVGLMAKYGTSDDTLSVSGDKDYYMVGVGLNYTLFDGGGVGAVTEKARLQEAQARQYQEYMKAGIALEVEKSYRTLKAKEAQVVQKERAQALSEEVLEKARLMYKNGLMTMTELLIKEAELLRARAELIKARFDRTLAAATLTIATGNDL